MDDCNCTFLRGVFQSDTDGHLTMYSIVAGCGRAQHFHIKAYPQGYTASNGTFVANSSAVHTGQFFDDDTLNAVAVTVPYANNSIAWADRVTNEDDQWYPYQDALSYDADMNITWVGSDITDGLLGSITVGLNMSFESVELSTQYADFDASLTVFPASDPHIPSFHVFNHFPKDIGLAILEQCSPFDLAQLTLTSRFLRSFIRTHRHLWTAAQSNIVHLPPPPAVEASGNYSQSAYAVWLFAGVVFGMDRFATFPFSVPFPSVFEGVSNARVFVDEKKKYENFSWGKWLPRVERRLPGGLLTHAYSTLAIQNADRERQQAIGVDSGNSRRDPRGFPCRSGQQLDAECNLRRQSRDALSKNAAALQDWHKRYITQHTTVLRANFEFLKSLSAAEDRKVQGVIRCPTMVRLFFAFNRDLALITYTVWMQYRVLVFAELKFLSEGVFPAEMSGRRHDKMRCSYCPRLIHATGMRDHVVDIHPNQNPDTIPGIKGPPKKCCPGCPESKRKFSKRGMQDHQLQKHKNDNISLLK
ncbi:hypothetical protein C8R44DRAFT_887582 [Mycena epipterygia]|nr:hypothetical protein C8R44DRAFT_887582 [Mycena epipterygia]